MNSSSSWSAVLSLVYGGNQLLWVAAQIALLVVIATVVRRHRPDAYRPLLAWSIVGLVFGVVGWVGGFAVRVVMARDGIDAMLKAQVATGLVGAVEHVILVVLLIRGLVALAQPPKVPITPAQPPYR
jgi:hypothetical protein